MADPAAPPNAAPPGGWSGRFGEPVTERVKRFTASVDFDRRLAAVDIAGSLAHARMLAAVGVLGAADLAAIERGMQQIEGEIERGEFAWSRDLEDVHLNIERRLTMLVGEPGKRLHTGRSRNDQIATDIRLWLRGEIDALSAALRGLRAALTDLADAHAGTIMPGFTHLQVAQPVTFGHHLLAYEAMLARDTERLADCRRRVNRLPLGSAALAGTSFPIDRARVAAELGFEGLCGNSLDAVSDRDFAIEFTTAASLAMLHLSRFAEELILWMSPRFGFIMLADRFCTGSSIMPQKKNPDVPELVRGKTGRVVGDLVALLMLVKGQPLAYNKDNQEDKEPLFDAVDTLADTLAVMTDLVATGIGVDAARMRQAASDGYATATDLADYLVKKGVAFRDAHEAVARAVRHAEAKGVDLPDLPLADLQGFAPAIAADVYAVLTLDGSVASRNHPGGTAPAQVRSAVAAARAALATEVRVRSHERAGPLPSANYPGAHSAEGSPVSAFAAVSDNALGFAAGTLTTIAFVPQLLRILKTRSAHDISWWMFGILIAGVVLWLWYGIRLDALPVILANAVTLALAVAIVLLKRRYHPRSKSKRVAPKPGGERISGE